MIEPIRQTAWLIERNDTYAVDDGPSPSWSTDPWRAARYPTWIIAEEARLRISLAAFRDAARPVEHVFIYGHENPEEHDDTIDEALSDAISDGEGRIYARYVRQHLAIRGLRIVTASIA